MSKRGEMGEGMKKGWEMAGGDKRGKGGVGDGERQGKEDKREINRSESTV